MAGKSKLLLIPDAGIIAVPEVFKAVVKASNALARLDELAENLENTEVFINSIPVLEAQASSEIENVVATHDSIFRADTSSAKADSQTLTALRLRRAIIAGADLARKRGITAKLAGTVCSEIMGRQMPVRTQPGTVIRSAGKTVYVPPQPEELPSLLAQWEKLVNREDLFHPLIVMAIAHYQFEAIHPFTDGNGRTGRVLNVLHLVASGELKQPVLQISQYLNTHRDEYYRRLRAVDSRSDWVGWILFLLEAVRVSAVQSALKLKQVSEMQLKFADRYMVPPDLAQLLFEKPYVQIGHVVERYSVTRVTAARWLETLERQGALKSLVSGRDKFFINHLLIKILGKN